MASHPSGGLIATGGADKKVLVWDVDGGFCTHYFTGHKGVVSCIMFHPDPEKHLVSPKLRYFSDRSEMSLLSKPVFNLLKLELFREYFPFIYIGSHYHAPVFCTLISKADINWKRRKLALALLFFQQNFVICIYIYIIITLHYF